MISQREVRCFLSKEFPDCGIDFMTIHGGTDIADLGMDFHDLVDMFEKVMITFNIRIDKVDYNKCTSISKLVYFINNAPEADRTFLIRLRAGYYR